MGCFTAFLSRLLFLGVWLWTSRIPNAFGDPECPLLGIIFCHVRRWRMSSPMLQASA